MGPPYPPPQPQDTLTCIHTQLPSLLSHASLPVLGIHSPPLFAQTHTQTTRHTLTQPLSALSQQDTRPQLLL